MLPIKAKGSRVGSSSVYNVISVHLAGTDATNAKGASSTFRALATSVIVSPLEYSDSASIDSYIDSPLYSSRNSDDNPESGSDVDLNTYSDAAYSDSPTHPDSDLRLDSSSGGEATGRRRKPSSSKRSNQKAGAVATSGPLAKLNPTLPVQPSKPSLQRIENTSLAQLAAKCESRLEDITQYYASRGREGRLSPAANPTWEDETGRFRVWRSELQQFIFPQNISPPLVIREYVADAYTDLNTISSNLGRALELLTVHNVYVPSGWEKKQAALNNDKGEATSSKVGDDEEKPNALEQIGLHVHELIDYIYWKIHDRIFEDMAEKETKETKALPVKESNMGGRAFTLLPNLSFQPDGDIRLGTLIARSGTTGLPDPSNVLNRDSHVEFEGEVHQTRSLSWSWEKTSRTPGSENSLSLTAAELIQRRFTPSPDYLFRSLQTLRASTPSTVYMVVGTAVALDLRITESWTEHSLMLKKRPVPNVVKSTLEQPSLLAYQLLRITLKRSSGFSTKLETKYAVF